MLSRVFNPTNTSLVASIHDGNPEPKTYFEAKASKEWQKWWEAMCTEFKEYGRKGSVEDRQQK
jgi:hypothetical protein